ncbi:MAG: ubiquinol-cytochrome c reductase iron-sulfur subunit [Candidatus Promineifilaceae bacterium]|nr:ubiquinol-cytochrome c reductase iron-sulfur subunit [Candidatus Promineifilaceae bacterium]
MAQPEENYSRRDFMRLATWAIGGLISAALAIPGVAYIVGPALQRGESEEWITLGAVSKVEIGTPTLFKTRIQQQTGWIVNETERSFYVLTDDGRNYVAMSNICTHLGCRVRWIADNEQFFCPCHNAVFDKEGEVVEGPPPRPLDRYEVRVENEQLLVLGG